MKTTIVLSPTWKNFLLHALAYLLWLVDMLVCAAAVIQLRSVVNVLWVALGGDRYTLSLANQVCLLLSGLAAFVYVMCLESYYRESVTPRAQKRVSDKAVPAKASSLRESDSRGWLTDLGIGMLLRRFAITTAIPLGMIILSLAIVDIALRILT